uniref:Uncharacterized protein n=1 Tax=Anguilla anguilla TaxID=7936 RepID=A0A0E9UN83_ANGAN
MNTSSSSGPEGQI